MKFRIAAYMYVALSLFAPNVASAALSSAPMHVDALDACRQSFIDATVADAKKKAASDMTSDEPIDDELRGSAIKQMMQPPGQFAIGYCLVKGHNYAAGAAILTSLSHTLGAEPALEENAKTSHLRILVFYTLAVANDGLHKHADAANAMKIAHDRAVDNSEDTSEFEDEYERLAPQQYKTEWAMRDRAAQNLERQRLAPIVAYWDQSSADEQRVLTQHGGTRRDNVKARPCHTELFSTRDGYHEVTWWYCDVHGGYVKAYTFLNGALHSEYRP